MPEDLEWPNTPLGMPSGYRQVLMVGSPKIQQLYTFRAKLPPDWRAMPHFHPEDEHITVLEGSCYLGKGEVYERIRGGCRLVRFQ
jgi:quercetin dioxygenase-like cupin family protein